MDAIPLHFQVAMKMILTWESVLRILDQVCKVDIEMVNNVTDYCGIWVYVLDLMSAKT